MVNKINLKGQLSTPYKISILQGDHLLGVLTEQHCLQPGVLGANHQDSHSGHIYVVSGLGGDIQSQANPTSTYHNSGWGEADIRLSEELATEWYRRVQDGPRVYKLLICQSVLKSFDSAQFILKELCYMNGRHINGKLIPNGGKVVQLINT